MKINAFTGLLLALPLTALLVSCHDDDDPDVPGGPETVLNSPEAYNLVRSGARTYIAPDAEYRVVYHAGNGTADLYISDLILAEGQAPQSYVLSALPCKYTNVAGVSTYEIDVNKAKADGGTNFSDIDVILQKGHSVNNRIYDRMAVNFGINNTEVSMLPKEILCYGRTVTTNTTDGSKHTSDRMLYRFSIKPGTTKADLYVSNADFVAGMPALGEMKFGDIDINYHDDGFTFSSARLIPSIDDVPSPNRVVTNLRGDVELDDEVEIDFNCMGVFSVNADLIGGLYLAD